MKHGHFGKEGDFEGFRGHRGRGRTSQFFESGDLLLLILHLINETPRHGYEIIKLIESELSGAYSPSPGTIYPALTMLEEIGFANVTTEGTRKLYAITEAGSKELEGNRVKLTGVIERLQRIGHNHVKERPGPIVRAMENLRMVLRMRSDQLTSDQIMAVSDIIDTAAKQIERL